MGDIGFGYGSEWHFMRFLGRHRKHLTALVLRCVNQGTHVDWLDFDFNAQSKYNDAELKGFRFLKESAYNKIYGDWRKFWPKTGNPHNWDGIGWLSDNRYPEKPQELLLVEAKAHTGELKSNCSAKNASKITIESAMNEVKDYLGVNKKTDWLNGYYQYANRIAALWFLRKKGLPTRLLFIYFLGDSSPGANCPDKKNEWDNALAEQGQHLGLTRKHPLNSYMHKLFIDVRGKTR